jgi:hypothetical protein
MFQIAHKSLASARVDPRKVFSFPSFNHFGINKSGKNKTKPGQNKIIKINANPMIMKGKAPAITCLNGLKSLFKP